jgi:3-methyladenine DNA glycosylase AlkC
MTAESKPSKKPAVSSYVPYSDWSRGSIERIKALSDECLDRFKEDKKLNTEILKMLSKLEALIEKKYSE